MTRSGKEPFPASSDAEGAERAAAILSPLERHVLGLSARDKLRNAAIAASLGISERRAQRILARALRKFARALEPRKRPWWKFW